MASVPLRCGLSGVDRAAVAGESMLDALQLALVMNTAAAVAFLSVFGLISVGLVQQRRSGLNALGIVTALLFLSCGLSHVVRVEHLLFDAGVLTRAVDQSQDAV